MLGEIMNVLTSIFDSFNTITLVDFIVGVLLIIALNTLIIYLIRRKTVIIITIGLSILFIISKVFCLDITAAVSFGVLLVFTLFILFLNMAEARSLFANKTKRVKKRISNKKVQDLGQIYDRDTLYNVITETVFFLSDHKYGALITFLRRDSLNDYIKSGTKVDAPVNARLLESIFYPGTQLHDGAVIVRGNIIDSASVIYNQVYGGELPGKVGTRHRAAIWIARNTDALTVVVSEETGNISIAYDGNIEVYTRDSFRKAFSNLMNESEIYDKYDGTKQE